MKLYYWEMTSGKRVHSPFCGKGKAKRKKVKGSRGGRDRCPGRAGKVDTGGNGEELQRRKCQEKGSAGLPGRVVTHLYASLHKPYGQSPLFRTQT